MEAAGSAIGQSSEAAVRALVERFTSAVAAGDLAQQASAWVPEDLIRPTQVVAPKVVPTGVAVSLYPPRLRQGGAAATDGLLHALDVHVLGDSAWALAVVGGGADGVPVHAIHHLVALGGRWYVTACFVLGHHATVGEWPGGAAPDGTAATAEVGAVHQVIARYYEACQRGDWTAGEALWAPVSWAFLATLEGQVEGAVDPTDTGEPVSFATVGIRAIGASQRTLWPAAAAMAPRPAQVRVWLLDGVAWALVREVPTVGPGIEEAAAASFGCALHQLVLLPGVGWRLAARVQVAPPSEDLWSGGITPIDGSAMAPASAPRPVAAGETAPAAAARQPAVGRFASRSVRRRRPWQVAPLMPLLRRYPYALPVAAAVLLLIVLLGINEVRARKPLVSPQAGGGPSGRGADTFTPPSTPRDRWPQLLATIGSKGSGAGQLADPRAVAVDAAGNVYVVDSAATSQMVKKFDPSGSPLAAWGGPGDANGRFTSVWAIATDRAGEVLVLDEATNWVQVFDANGAFLRKWGGPDMGAYHPRSMAVDATDTVYIADTGRKRVLLYGVDGTPRGDLGSAPTLPEAERLVEPAGVAAARDGSVYVADAPARLIRRYPRAGRQQSAWPIGGADAIDGPRLAVAPGGSVYATLPGACAVVQLDPSGAPVRSFGACGADDYLGRPAGLAVDAAGKLYVADIGLGVVRVYGP